MWLLTDLHEVLSIPQPLGVAKWVGPVGSTRLTRLVWRGGLGFQTHQPFWPAPHNPPTRLTMYNSLLVFFFFTFLNFFCCWWANSSTRQPTAGGGARCPTRIPKSTHPSRFRRVNDGAGWLGEGLTLFAIPAQPSLPTLKKVSPCS